MRLLILLVTLLLTFLTPVYSQWEFINEGISGWPEKIYFIDQQHGWLSGNNCLLKTDDGGENWKNVPLPKNQRFDMINMTGDSVGWALPWEAPKAVFKTENGGLDWKQVYEVPQSNDGHYGYSLDALNDSIVFTAGHSWLNGLDNFISKTTDGGENWTTLFQIKNREMAEISVSDSKTAMALGRVYDKRDGSYKWHEVSILRTADGGETWQEIILNEFKENEDAWNLQYVNDSSAFFLARRSLNDSNKCYLYASVDSGRSWKAVSEMEIYIDDYQFINSKTGFALIPDGILKSNDGGYSWENINSDISGSSIFFSDQNTGFILAGSNLWKSRDGGLTWTQRIFTYPFWDVFFFSNQRGFVCGGPFGTGGHSGSFGDLFFTDNGGGAWQHQLGFVTGGFPPPPPPQVDSLIGGEIRSEEVIRSGGAIKSIEFINESNGLILLSSQIYRTFSGGKNWTRIYYSNPDLFGFRRFNGTEIKFFNEQCIIASGRAFWSDDSSGAALLSSKDGGASWTLDWKLPDNEKQYYYLNDLCVVSNTIWAVGSAGLIMRKTMDHSFQIMNSVTDIPLNTVFFSDEKHGWISGGYYDSVSEQYYNVFLSTSDGGQNWQQSPTFNYNVRDIYFADSLQGWAVGTDTADYGIILQTVDGGINWETQITKLSGSLVSLHFKNGQGWVVGDNGLILKTDLWYENIYAQDVWLNTSYMMPQIDTLILNTKFINNFQHNFSANAFITSVDSFYSDSISLYDDGQHGDWQNADGTWGNYIYPLPIEQEFIIDVSTTDQGSGNYFIVKDMARFTTIGPLVVSNVDVSGDTVRQGSRIDIKLTLQNKGVETTANNISVSITSLDTLASVIGVVNPIYGNIAAGHTAQTSGGYKIDIHKNSPISHRAFFQADILANGHVFWVDTFSVLIDTPTGILPKSDPFPEKFALTQNYPNPFNPKTAICYSLPVTCNLKISIYNILGQKVATLVNKKQPAGKYQVEWDASKVSSGVYYYRLETEGYSDVKKMVVIK